MILSQFIKRFPIYNAGVYTNVNWNSFFGFIYSASILGMGNSFELILDPQIPELELGSSPEQTSINHPKNIHRKREKKRERGRESWHKNRKQAGLKFKSNLPVCSIPLSLSLCTLSLSFYVCVWPLANFLIKNNRVEKCLPNTIPSKACARLAKYPKL